MFGNNALKEISEGLENILENTPEKVTRNVLWDVTVLYRNTVKASETIKDVYGNPGDFHSCAPYFFSVMGLGRLCSLLKNYKGITEDQLQLIDKLKNINKKISNIGSPIFDEDKKDKKVFYKILNLYATALADVELLWISIISQNNTADSLKSFKDRDMSEYIQHITEHKLASSEDSNKEFIDFFIEKTLEHLAN